MAPRMRLGELLISEGLIDEIQLNSAIGHQRNWGGKLGSTLVELGFIGEDEIARALERQLRLTCLSDKDLVPEESALGLFTGQECLEHDMLPLRLEGSVLHMAMSNPYDLNLIDEIGFRLGKKVRAVLAVESSIKRAVKKHYFGEEGGRNYRVDMAPASPDEPMQVVHASGAKMESGPSAEPDPSPEPQRKVEPSAEIVSKALAYLLIEKGIIKREELIAKMKSLHEKSQG